MEYRRLIECTTMNQNWNLKLNGMKKISYLFARNTAVFLFVICLTLFVFYSGYKMSMEQVRVQMEIQDFFDEFMRMNNDDDIPSSLSPYDEEYKGTKKCVKE